MQSSLRFLLPLLLAAVCVAMLAMPIDISNSDLGRHLKNGEWIARGTPAQRAAVLSTNFYSFAAPDAPFVNHHWLSGVVFHQVWRALSFHGLSIFYMLLVTGAVLLAYAAAVRSAGVWLAAAWMFPAAPLIAWRAEIRPEAFTLLLLAAAWFVLAEWRAGRLSARWLWTLPPLLCLWVNLHSGFVLGFLLLAVFLMATRSRPLLAVALASLAAACLNPAGVAGVLYPLQLLGKIEYPVAELASFADLRARGLWSWVHPYFLALAALGAGAFVWRWLHPRQGERFPAVDALLYAVLALLTISQVRNMQPFLVLAVPLLAAVTAPAKPASHPAAWVRAAGLAGIAIGLIVTVQLAPGLKSTRGIGLRAGVNAPIDFFRTNQIRGPIFNDFDIGGYLIFHLPGPSPVFVDGRPEAYPPGFFDRTYAAALNEDSIWREQDARFHFNAIMLSMQDAYPGVERFILTRVRDGAWAPVYADDFAIIFVRDIPEHAGLIARHRIPRQMFR